MEEAKQISEASKQPSLRGMYRLEFQPEGLLLMSDGKWKEGIERLRRDAFSDPPRAGAYLRYAAGLLEAGLRDEAIKMCRKAIEADPKSARAYGYLAALYEFDPIGRQRKKGMNLPEAEKAAVKAAELDPEDKRYISQRAFIKETGESGEMLEGNEKLVETIGLLEGIAKDLPKLQQQNLLAEALFRARRFADLKAFYEREEGRGARIDMRYAAIAALDGVPAMLREAAEIQPDEPARKANYLATVRLLISTGEYAKGADLLVTANPAQSSAIALLRAARRRQDRAPSKDPVIGAVEQYIDSLCDPEASPKWSDLTASEWQSLTMISRRAQLLSLFSAYRNVAGTALGTRQVADVAIGNIEWIKQGNDQAGYRVRFADPSASGAMKTFVWVARRGEAYKILGFRGDEAVSGGEALALAKKGDLENARRWLDWQREELTPSASADPLASQPFFKLWPPSSDLPEKDQILAAAACLVARGKYSSDGLEALESLRANAHGTLANVLDQAIADGYRSGGKFAEEIPAARNLYRAYPGSAVALTTLASALAFSGQPEEALKLAAASTGKDEASAAARARISARAHALLRQYAEAAQDYRGLCDSGKCTAVDWNNLAWMTLFVPGKLPDLKAAETAVRLTQERTPAYVHTMAALSAEIGKLKESRANLVRYMQSFDEVNGSAWLVEGRIAEALGLKDAAIEIYSNIAAPARPIGDDAYDMAQIRLALLRNSN